MEKPALRGVGRVHALAGQRQIVADHLLVDKARSGTYNVRYTTENESHCDLVRSYAPEGPRRSRGVPVGYAFGPMRAEIRRFARTRPLKMAALALADIATVIAVAGGCTLLTNAAGALPGALFYMATLPLLGSRLRGLECLVHDGAHYNWSRESRKGNDLLADLLAAAPMLSSIAAMRQSHGPHHGDWAGATDVDLPRYNSDRLHDLRCRARLSPWRFALEIGVRLPRYAANWFRAIGTSPAVAARGVAWHACVLLFPLTMAFGVHDALVYWTAFFAIPFLFVLPVIRLIGEADEHDYQATTIFEGTISNISFWAQLLIHPHGDGYHTLHHIAAWIPGPELARAHEWLMRADPHGYGSQMRLRPGILADPQKLAEFQDGRAR
ncbi:MAG: fatty acid desaturase [Byssovorax sp.]